MNKKGFTLTEILIVLVVAGILLALILPNSLKAIERSNLTAHLNNLKTIKTAMFMCYTETKDWSACDTQDELVNGKYLDSWPSHPFGGTYTIEDDPDGTAGKVVCSNGSENLPADAPADCS
jgi:prepilin-type N-terminal cleavage/methylation domain-containing protein